MTENKWRNYGSNNKYSVRCNCSVQRYWFCVTRKCNVQNKTAVRNRLENEPEKSKKKIWLKMKKVTKIIQNNQIYPKRGSLIIHSETRGRTSHNCPQTKLGSTPSETSLFNVSTSLDKSDKTRMNLPQPPSEASATSPWIFQILHFVWTSLAMILTHLALMAEV